MKNKLSVFKLNNKKLIKLPIDLEDRTDFDIDDRYCYETTLYKSKLRLVKYPNKKYPHSDYLTIYLNKLHRFYLFIYRLLNMDKNLNNKFYIKILKLFNFLNINKSIDLSYVEIKDLYNIEYAIYSINS